MMWLFEKSQRQLLNRWTVDLTKQNADQKALVYIQWKSTPNGFIPFLVNKVKAGQVTNTYYKHGTKQLLLDSLNTNMRGNP